LFHICTLLCLRQVRLFIFWETFLRRLDIRSTCTSEANIPTNLPPQTPLYHHCSPRECFCPSFHCEKTLSLGD
uniref:Uncharacterized protein n=1 Tax=Pygocentrus nattereri TaxID=42514 RepID=A0A3B4DCW7_PYGNA